MENELRHKLKILNELQDENQALKNVKFNQVEAIEEMKAEESEVEHQEGTKKILNDRKMEAKKLKETINTLDKQLKKDHAMMVAEEDKIR